MFSISVGKFAFFEATSVKAFLFIDLLLVTLFFVSGSDGCCFFYGFISIGAPFKQNVFANLFIAHSVAFFLINRVKKRASEKKNRG